MVVANITKDHNKFSHRLKTTFDCFQGAVLSALDKRVKYLIDIVATLTGDNVHQLVVDYV